MFEHGRKRGGGCHEMINMCDLWYGNPLWVHTELHIVWNSQVEKVFSLLVGTLVDLFLGKKCTYPLLCS